MNITYVGTYMYKVGTWHQVMYHLNIWLIDYLSKIHIILHYNWNPLVQRYLLHSSTTHTYSVTNCLGR